MRYVLLLLPVLLVDAEGQCAEWHSSGDGSEFTFETTFEGESIGGSFKNFDVKFDFEAANPSAGHLIVTVWLNAADMGDPDMNSVLFDQAWFDVERFESAVFESHTVEARSSNEFIAIGILTLKDVKQSVTVPFVWSRNGNEARMQGEFMLQRTDFGVGTGEWAAGDTIGITTHLAFDVLLKAAE